MEGILEEGTACARGWLPGVSPPCGEDQPSFPWACSSQVSASSGAHRGGQGRPGHSPLLDSESKAALVCRKEGQQAQLARYPPGPGRPQGRAMGTACQATQASTFLTGAGFFSHSREPGASGGSQSFMLGGWCVLLPESPVKVASPGFQTGSDLCWNASAMGSSLPPRQPRMTAQPQRLLGQIWKGSQTLSPLVAHFTKEKTGACRSNGPRVIQSRAQLGLHPGLCPPLGLWSKNPGPCPSLPHSQRPQ